jgi:hypothetical protein
MDPALMCTSTGDGEQTIGQIQTRGEHGRFIFFYGPDADGRSTDLQSDCLGSIPTVSTKTGVINRVLTRDVSYITVRFGTSNF